MLDYFGDNVTEGKNSWLASIPSACWGFSTLAQSLCSMASRLSFMKTLGDMMRIER